MEILTSIPSILVAILIALVSGFVAHPILIGLIIILYVFSLFIIDNYTLKESHSKYKNLATIIFIISLLILTVFQWISGGRPTLKLLSI
ncbi:MAG: hypothetical protein WC587_00880 [Candidatus Paceibacterota bacterium]